MRATVGKRTRAAFDLVVTRVPEWAAPTWGGLAKTGPEGTASEGTVSEGAGSEGRAQIKARPGGQLETVPSRPSRWWYLGWLLPLALQLGHTLAVVPYYHVGSFDDDGNYLMAAHVLASGGGLTTVMPSGASVVANYLPGYPALLVPLIWVFGSALWVPRAFSTLCVALLYPLVWAWLSRRGVRPGYGTVALGVLALNPVMATYSTMVMAEAPFVVLLMLALLAVDAWEQRASVPWAGVIAFLLAALIWVKEAGVGLGIGLVVYLLWRRRWRWAVGIGAGIAVLMVPALAARWATGGSPLGDRYANDISNSSKGGFVHQLPTELVEDIWSYAQTAFRQAVMPIGSPLPTHGPLDDVLAVLGFSVPVFVVVGALAWYRRHPRAETWMVGIYFAETLAYPYTNQRRVVLVLPVVIVWYVIGAATSGRWVLFRLRRALPLNARATTGVLSAITALALVVAIAPTAAAFSKDYMYKQGLQSSRFAGTASMELLKALGTPQDVVETDYRGSVAYFADHRTAWLAFTSTHTEGPFPGRGNCTVAKVGHYLRSDRAKYLFLGDINVPGVLDSPCLMSLVSRRQKAQALGVVRLLSTPLTDHESVFEVLGPGTTQPNLVSLTGQAGPAGAAVVRLAPNGQGDVGGTAYRLAARDGKAVYSWSWSGPHRVTQVTVGMVTGTAPITDVTVALRTPGPDGPKWRTVSHVSGAVRQGGKASYLLAKLRPGTIADGMRVTVTTTGTAEVAYAEAIGSAGDR